MDPADFSRIGRRLFAEHLVGGNFGNLSVREGAGFFIKRAGAYLDEPGDPVFVPFDGDAPADASSEYKVHRAVYQRKGYIAIVHAHPPYAIAASLRHGELVPMDSEGKMFCPVIPVVKGEPGTEELAQNVAEALTRAPVTIARGHGTFAAGKSLDEAFVLTSLTEHSCRTIGLAGLFR